MAKVPNASAENSMPSDSSQVIITSGQCTIGAVTKRRVVPPSDSVSPSPTAMVRVEKSMSSKKLPIMATALAVATTLVSGYRVSSAPMLPE